MKKTAVVAVVKNIITITTKNLLVVVAASTKQRLKLAS